MNTRVAAFLLLILLQSFPTATASAHAVFIYARPDGGRICTESWFSKKNRVKGGEVRMEDAQGGLLASGTTDGAGIVCFSAPEGAGDLRFIVLAGQGHRAEFALPALKDAVPPTMSAMPEASAPAGTPRSPAAAEHRPVYGIAPPPAGGDGPGLRDIIGGAGWLVGVAGFGAFAASRRKKN